MKHQAIAQDKPAPQPVPTLADDMAIPLDSSIQEPLALDFSSAKPGLTSKEPASELVEPGRDLVLSDFNPPEISAGERLMRLAYRVGIPGSAIVAPFRKPMRPRLLATVESPLEGDRVAGMALRAGHFLIHGVKAPLTQVDYASTAQLTGPFERTVHGFTWLRDLAACGQPQQCAPTAERVLSLWLAANDKPGKGAAWRIGNAGHRLLGWLVHAPLVLSVSEKNRRTDLLATIEATARWLDRNVGKAEDRLDELAGWCGVIAAGLLLPEGKPRRLFGEAGLARNLGELIGNDGGVLSRSPLAQMEAITLLVELRACYRATRREPPRAIETMLQMLVPPLLALTHGDGALGNWQGAGAVSQDRLQRLIGASGVRTRPLRDARQWGYQRVVAGKSILHCDAAPPPLARHARHGCASTLAFEMSHGAQRLVVNCGGAAFAGGLVPVRIEQGLRATAAHSTLALGDANSTAVLINGKLGAGVGEVEVDRRTVELPGGGTATRVEASHDGYVGRYGLVHRRILLMRDDGTELRGEDVLLPAGRKGKRGKVPFALRFHLGPGIELSLSENGHGASMALPDGGYWQFVSASGDIAVDESIWVDGEGRPHPVQQLVIEGLASRGGGNFSWVFKKIS